MIDSPYLAEVREAFTAAKLASVYESDEETARVLFAFLRVVEDRFALRALIEGLEIILEKRDAQ